MKKLFLLDAFALIFRAYFAFARNPRVTSKGLDTSAVYGFLLALLDVIEKEKPSHLAVVFDIGGSEVREQLFQNTRPTATRRPKALRLRSPTSKSYWGHCAFRRWACRVTRPTT